MYSLRPFGVLGVVVLREELEPWAGSAGGLENLGVWDLRDEGLGRISAGGARETRVGMACERCVGRGWEEWSRQKDS